MKPLEAAEFVLQTLYTGTSAIGESTQTTLKEFIASQDLGRTKDAVSYLSSYLKDTINITSNMYLAYLIRELVNGLVNSPTKKSRGCDE